jgi:hypothetical protein
MAFGVESWQDEQVERCNKLCETLVRRKWVTRQPHEGMMITTMLSTHIDDEHVTHGLGLFVSTTSHGKDPSSTEG